MSVIAPTVKILMRDLNLEEDVANKLRAVLKAPNPRKLCDLVAGLEDWRGQLFSHPRFVDVKFEAARIIMDDPVGWQIPILRQRDGAMIHYLGGVDAYDSTLCYCMGRYFISTLDSLLGTGREVTNDELF